MATIEQHGVTALAFGFKSTDAPTIANFFARGAELKFEPEVFETAMDGEGNVEAIAVTKLDSRKITGSFTGYVPASLGSGGSNAIANAFNFVVNSITRYFIIKSIGEPRPKGKYVEVSIEVESHSLVTALAP